MMEQIAIVGIGQPLVDGYYYIRSRIFYFEMGIGVLILILSVVETMGVVVFLEYLFSR